MGARDTLEDVLRTVEYQYGYDFVEHFEDGVDSGKLSYQSISKRRNDLEEYIDSLNEEFQAHPNLWNNGNYDYLVRAINLAYVQPRILFCIDIEAWEQNNDLITEIGISIYDPTVQDSKEKGRRSHLESIHVVIEEYEDLYNGKYVADNKYNFSGDRAMIMNKVDTKRYLQALVQYYFILIPKKFGIETVLVGHALKGDIDWLRRMEVTFPRSTLGLDTQKIWATTMGTKYNSLTRILSFMKISHAYLHKAGNDAYYTLLVCLALCNPQIRAARKVNESNYSSLVSGTSYLQMTAKIVEHERIDDFKEALIKTFGLVKQCL